MNKVSTHTRDERLCSKKRTQPVEIFNALAAREDFLALAARGLFQIRWHRAILCSRALRQRRLRVAAQRAGRYRKARTRNAGKHVGVHALRRRENEVGTKAAGAAPSSSKARATRRREFCPTSRPGDYNVSCMA